MSLCHLKKKKIYNNRDEQKKNWFEARDFCRAIGGDLLSVHSAKDLSRTECVFFSSLTQNIQRNKNDRPF